jgi:hypothetical protein
VASCETLYRPTPWRVGTCTRDKILSDTCRGTKPELGYLNILGASADRDCPFACSTSAVIDDDKSQSKSLETFGEHLWPAVSQEERTLSPISRTRQVLDSMSRFHCRRLFARNTPKQTVSVLQLCGFSLIVPGRKISSSIRSGPAPLVFGSLLTRIDVGLAPVAAGPPSSISSVPSLLFCWVRCEEAPPKDRMPFFWCGAVTGAAQGSIADSPCQREHAYFQ